MVHENCINTINNVPHPPTWRGWLQDGWYLLIRELRRVWATVKIWRQRARSRGELRRLDARMRGDIGVTRDEAMELARKPFWKS